MVDFPRPLRREVRKELITQRGAGSLKMPTQIAENFLLEALKSLEIGTLRIDWKRPSAAASMISEILYCNVLGTLYKERTNFCG